MISMKGHDMICKLMRAAGQATDKDEMVKSWTEIEDYIAGLEEALRYVVKCNDEAMPNPETQQWMCSPCRAQCTKALENK